MIWQKCTSFESENFFHFLESCENMNKKKVKIQCAHSVFPCHFSKFWIRVKSSPIHFGQAKTNLYPIVPSQIFPKPSVRIGGGWQIWGYICPTPWDPPSIFLNFQVLTSKFLRVVEKCINFHIILKSMICTHQAQKHLNFNFQ